METTPNTEVFRRVIEQGFNRGNFDAWDECFSPTIQEHQYGLPSTLAEFKQAIAGLRRAMPDLKLTIDEMITSGDKVWARMTSRGTHQGPFMGLAPTGKSFTITVMDVCRFEGGKIVEHWGVPDRFALMHQLGLLSGPPKQAGA
ncbi:MAG: ester cyclase [Polyangiaceae bacterium]|nr:ester cyclase [Polyangiaceae bacterium]